MVADGYGLSRMVPQLLSPPRASADARTHCRITKCGRLRVPTPPRAACHRPADGGALQAGHDACGCGSRRVAHARSCTAAVRRGMARSARDAAYASMCARMPHRHSLFARSARARAQTTSPTTSPPPVAAAPPPTASRDLTSRPRRRRAPVPRTAADTAVNWRRCFQCLVWDCLGRG